MRAIKIDVKTKTVYEVDQKGLNDIYKHLECECMCQVGRRLPNGDMLLVDDDGLLKPAFGAFYFGDYPQPLSGHGLFVGTDGAGEDQDAMSAMDYVKFKVRWADVGDLPRPYFKVVSMDDIVMLKGKEDGHGL